MIHVCQGKSSLRPFLKEAVVRRFADVSPDLVLLCKGGEETATARVTLLHPVFLKGKNVKSEKFILR